MVTTLMLVMIIDDGNNSDASDDDGNNSDASDDDGVLPTVGITLSWHVDASRKYFKKAGTVVVSTEGAGTGKDYDTGETRKRSKQQQTHVAVTMYTCVEIGTPTGWLYVETGDFVEIDVVSDAGTRSRQIVEVSK